MNDLPFEFLVNLPGGIPDRFDRHLQRHLSDLRGQFLDAAEYERLLAIEDRLVYEVYEFRRPETSGELLCGLSIVHPGLVGREFHMTKGHFHTVLDTAEIYYCLQGEGMMVMETPEGQAHVAPLTPGRVLYVPPRWAHRSVCTGRQVDLVTFFVYPGHAGHDYGTIERQGFRKLVLQGPDGVEVVENPRWRPPEEGR